MRRLVFAGVNEPPPSLCLLHSSPFPAICTHTLTVICLSFCPVVVSVPLRGSAFCHKPGCQSHPNFGIEGDRRAIYCAKHKLQGMVNVKAPRCRCAHGSPTFWFQLFFFFCFSAAGGKGGVDVDCTAVDRLMSNARHVPFTEVGVGTFCSSSSASRRSCYSSALVVLVVVVSLVVILVSFAASSAIALTGRPGAPVTRCTAIRGTPGPPSVSRTRAPSWSTSRTAAASTRGASTSPPSAWWATAAPTTASRTSSRRTSTSAGPGLGPAEHKGTEERPGQRNER